MSSLSICLISKNEENNLRKCLGSVAHIADEIILVDTGSTDNTVAVAKEFNAKVINTIWENDFSKPRNLSIENATSDWILLLDCDEELPYEYGIKLKNLINSNTSKEAYHLKIRTLLSNQDSGCAIVLRLFRNREEYRFEGKMHEQIINSILARSGSESIGMEEIIIDHYGYDPDISDQQVKSKRNLEILLSYDEKDKDGYYYYALGNEYSRLTEYDKALEIYNVCLNMTNYKKNKNIYFSYLLLNIMKLNYTMKKYNKVIECFEYSQKEIPNFRDSYFMGALAYIEMGKYTKAKENMLKYLSIKEENFEFPSNNFDKSYNINEMMEQMNTHIVGPCLSTVVFVSNPPQNVKETIRSVNEISNDVVFVIDNDHINILDDFLEEIKNYGATVLNLKKENFKKDLHFISKTTKGDYLLLLNDNEIVYHGYLQLFPSLYNYSNKLGFVLETRNLVNDLVSEDIKIIKKDKKFKNIQNLKEYATQNKKTLANLNIQIYKGNNF